MAKKLYHLEDNPDVDYRTDTTRPGYSPVNIPYGAGNTFVGANPLDAILSAGDATDPRNDNYNPNLITGVAPTVGMKPSARLGLTKSNKLDTFVAVNGKTYVRLPNGKVQSLTNYNLTSQGLAPLSKEAEAAGAKSNAQYNWMQKQDARAKIIKNKIKQGEGTVAVNKTKKTNNNKSTLNSQINKSNKLFVEGGRSKYNYGGKLNLDNIILE